MISVYLLLDWLFFDKIFAFSLVLYEKMIMLNLNHFVLHL